MADMTVKITVDVADINISELLLTGSTELHWAIDGRQQEPLIMSYEPEEKTQNRSILPEPSGKLQSFIPQIWRQVQERRAIERYKEMKDAEELQQDGYGVSTDWPTYNEQRGFVAYDLGDAIDRKTFDHILADARRQVIVPYDKRSAMKFYPPVMDEAVLVSEAAVSELARRITLAFGVSAAEVGEIYNDWKQEYLSGSQLGYFPNPATMPPVMPATVPAKKPEPEFGVVVVNHNQVPLSTVNALLSGKFIQEGEQIDTSFKQYIVLFNNDDYNRGEAVNLRQQLRDLIPGVDVVLMPMNGA